jgi:hypothetical protein
MTHGSCLVPKVLMRGHTMEQTGFQEKAHYLLTRVRYFMDYVTDAIYANGQWVAVTRLGRIFTGTNQHTWTERTSPFGGTYINKVLLAMVIM